MNRIEAKKRIHVVDDEEINLDLMQGILEDDYDVECFSDGESFLQQCTESSADLVLLDVNMPGLGGLDVCQRLHDSQPQCPVIFVSARASNEERLAGYTAGGYDYIVKPCDPQELLAKISLIMQQQEQQNKFEESHQAISDAFMEAACGSGEQGVLLQFAVNVFNAKNYSQLAEQVLSTLHELGGLKAGILVVGQQESITLSDSGPCPPMEEEILVMLKEKGRIYHFNDRVQINEKNVSVLVRNMPEDEMVAGRMIDHIPLLLRIASACVESIDTSNNLTSSLGVIETVQNTYNNLTSTEKDLRMSMLGFTALTEKEFQRMENEMQFLALSEEQENKLTMSYSTALEQARNSSQQAMKISSRLGEIINDLRSLF